MLARLIRVEISTIAKASVGEKTLQPSSNSLWLELYHVQWGHHVPLPYLFPPLQLVFVIILPYWTSVKTLYHTYPFFPAPKGLVMNKE